MKRISILFASALAAISMVACQSKENLENKVVEEDDLILNVTVGNPNGGDTKAVKTAWTAGDRINIWFDQNYSSYEPHYVLVYDGSKWNGVKNPQISNAWFRENLKTDGTGTIAYTYEGTNRDYFQLSSSEYMTLSSSQRIKFATGSFTYNSNTLYYNATPLLLANSNLEVYYQFDCDNSTLTMNLDDWRYLTNFQVVVTDLEGDPEDWYMQVTANSNYGYKWSTFSAYSLEEKKTPNYVTTTDYCRGSANEDGIAFFFRNTSNTVYNIGIDNTPLTLEFRMINKNGTLKTKTIRFIRGLSSPYVQNGGSLSSAYDFTFSAVKFSLEGTKKYLDGVFSVSDTKKVNFARGNLYYNIASGKWNVFYNMYKYDTDQTENISLFTWGYDSSYSTDPNTTSYCSDIKSGNLPAEKDWSTATLGSKWRTLSADEWDYVFNKRTMTNNKPRYTAFFDSNMVTVEGTEHKGLFIYPDDYNGDEIVANTSLNWQKIEGLGIVFLPAPGYRDNTGSLVTAAISHQAFYWTTTAFDATNGYAVNRYYVSALYKRQRSMGLAVRPVRDFE